MSIPAYEQVRRRERRATLSDFLMDMVISDEFDLDDFETIESHIDSATSEIEAFCEWFGLGEWFADEMTAIEFDLEEFMLTLKDRLIEADNEASKDYREREEEYRRMTGGVMG